MTVGKPFKLSLIWDVVGISSSIRLEVMIVGTYHIQFSLASWVPVEILSYSSINYLIFTSIRSRSNQYMTIWKLLKLALIWDVSELSSSIHLEVMIEWIQINFCLASLVLFYDFLKDMNSLWNMFDPIQYTTSKQIELESPTTSQIKDNFKGFLIVIY